MDKRKVSELMVVNQQYIKAEYPAVSLATVAGYPTQHAPRGAFCLYYSIKQPLRKDYKGDAQIYGK